MKKNEKIIFHRDINNAFLSMTAVKLLNEGYDTDIRTIPAIIAHTDGRNGVVLASSSICKEIGIKAGMPVVHAFNIYSNVKVFQPDYEYYKNTSKNIYLKLLSYTELVEQASIDEWYLDVTDYLFNTDYLTLAKKIQNDIFNQFKITVNIGISNTKKIAKTASDLQKPNKIIQIFNNELEEKLWPLDISKLFLVGEKTLEILKKHRILKIGDLANSDKDYIYRILGKSGIKLRESANGIDDSKVKAIPDKLKSISREITFSSPTDNVEYILTYLMKITEYICNRLRKNNFKTENIGIIIKYENFFKKSKQEKIMYTDNTNEIFKKVKQLFIDSYRRELKVRLVGVKLDKLKDNNDLLESEKNIQLNLFDFECNLDKLKNEIKKKKTNPRKKEIDHSKLDYVLDELNQKYGTNTLKRASSLLPSEIKNKSINISANKKGITFGYSDNRFE